MKGGLMPSSDRPTLKARISNRLAQRFLAAPVKLPRDQAMVSFTFDDVPDSAASAAAPMLEEYGGCGTFYISGSLVDKASEYWNGITADEIVELHHRGHEIACHTFSHTQASELGARSMDAEIEQNRRYFEALDPSIRLENFAYPYGFASIMHKTRLRRTFRSARGIEPGINTGKIDLQFLCATPLINGHIDADGIEHIFDRTATGGWLIFYGHDVQAQPSPYGCTPGLLRSALRAAASRNIPVVSVAQALQRIGA